MDTTKTEFRRDIKQSKELPRFRYKLGVTEQKMLLCMFGQLKQNQNVFEPEHISADDIVKYCGFDKINEHQQLRVASKNLASETLEYYNGKEFIYVPWFNYIHYKNGIISYQLNEAIRTELLQLYENKKVYINVDPRILPFFKNNYAIRLYLIFKGDMTCHKINPTYSIEEICYMLALPDAYNPKKNENAVSNQKTKIIEPAIQEINTISDLMVEYNPVKFARKTTGWEFIIKNNTTNNNPYLNLIENNDTEPEETYDLTEDILEEIRNAKTWPEIILLAKKQTHRSIAINIFRYASEAKKRILKKYCDTYMYKYHEAYEIDFQIMMIGQCGIRSIEEPIKN